MPSQKTTATLTTLVLSLSLAGSVWLGAVKYPPGKPDHYGAMHRYASNDVGRCALYRTIGLLGEGPNRDNWNRCAQEFVRTQTLEQFNRRYWLVAAFSIALLFSLFWLGPVWRQDRRAPKIVRGRTYHRGAKARQKFRKASIRDCKKEGSALEFPKGIPFAWDRENRHMLIWGSVGSGKTQIMLNLISSIQARGDKMLILDTKGDMTAGLEAPFTLLAPQDARSKVWNVAADCRTKQDARELAAKLIPEGADRIWSDAARTVLTACLCHVQANQPGNWTWHYLRQAVTSDLAALREIATKHYPEALHILSEEGGRTTQSVLTTLQSHMHAISALADAWGATDAPQFSVTGWIESKEQEPPVILQYDGKYPDLSNAWISSLIATISGIISSPAFAEDRHRRIWLFLDEFPQLNPLEHFSTLLDTGRSKGICVVLGMQDVAQLKDTYGQHKADAWLGMIGTHIITRMNLGRSAEVACHYIGKQDVETQHRTRSTSASGTSYASTIRIDTKDVVTVSDLAGNLGPQRKGVRAIILGPGSDVYEIDFPYVSLPPLRAPSEPANWTRETPRATHTDMPPKTPLLSQADLARIKRTKPS